MDRSCFGGEGHKEPGRVDKLKGVREALLKANQSYWAEQVEVQVLGAQAWAALGSGDKSKGLKLMREAAELEDSSAKHVAMENRLYPMRELLADMLLLQDDPAGALKEYETSMRNSPNRLRGFFGAAQAAGATGNTVKRGEYLRSLAQLTQGADSDREEIPEARTKASR